MKNMLKHAYFSFVYNLQSVLKCITIEIQMLYVNRGN